MFKYLEIHFSNVLFQYNFNFIIFGIKPKTIVMVPPYKIFKYKQKIKFKKMFQLNLNKYSYSKLKFIMINRDSLPIIANPLILSNRIFSYAIEYHNKKKNLILFLLLYCYIKMQIKKLLIKKIIILCHN